jgi:hypothetical protein
MRKFPAGLDRLPGAELSIVGKAVICHDDQKIDSLETCGASLLVTHPAARAG